MGPVQAAFLLTGQTAAYRIRRREANNLLTSIALMLAFHLPWWDVLYRGLFAALLNLYIYLMNDYCDIERDLGSPQKDQAKAQFLADNRGAARGALLVMAALLLGAGAWHSTLLVAAVVVNSAVIYSYSRWLKNLAVVDVLMMTLAGVTMSLVALPQDSLLAWKMAGLLGCVSASFEVIQVIRDEPDDRLTGVRTTAVLLGAARAAWLFRAIVAGTAAYVALLLGSPLGLLMLAALFFPLTPERASRTWDLCRGLFGSVFLGLLAQAWLGHIG